MSETTPFSNPVLVALKSKMANVSRPVAVLGGLFLLLPFILYFAPKGLVVWVLLAILAVPSLQDWQRELAPNWLGYADRTLGIVILWAFISLFWAETPGFEKAVRLTIFCGFGAAFLFALQTLSSEDRGQIQKAAFLCVFMTALLLLFETSTSLFLSGLFSGDSMDDRMSRAGQSIAAMVTISWPLLGLVATGQMDIRATYGTTLVGIILISLAFAAFKLQAFVALMALIMGGLALLLVHWRPRLGIALVGTAILGYLIFAPSLHMLPFTSPEMATLLPPTWAYKLKIWYGAAEGIFKAPIVGAGFSESAITVPGLDPDATFAAANPSNLFLQVWLELGLVGAILFGLVLWSILVQIWARRHAPLQAGLTSAAFVSYITVALLNFGAWQTWWIATAWIAAGTAALIPPREIK